MSDNKNMPPEKSTITRIFEILDELRNGQSDMRERITRVEGKVDSIELKQEHHYVQNQSEHNSLVALINDHRTDLNGLQKGHEEQQAVLEQRKGERRILGCSWQLVLAVVSSGAIFAVIGWLFLNYLKG